LNTQATRNAPQAVDRSNGRFEIRGVRPGRYELWSLFRAAVLPTRAERGSTPAIKTWRMSQSLSARALTSRCRWSQRLVPTLLPFKMSSCGSKIRRGLSGFPAGAADLKVF